MRRIREQLAALVALVVVAVAALALGPRVEAAGDPPPASPARSSDPSELAPPVDSLVAMALARSPSIDALQERSLAAQAMVRARAALSNPMIEFMLQDEDFPRWTVGEMPMSMVTVELSQRFPFPGQRAARRRTAAAESRIAAMDVEKLRRQVIAQVRDVYGSLYAVDAEWEALAEAHHLLRLAVHSSAARYEANQAEQEVLLSAQLALARTEERVDDLEVERAELLAVLNRLLDLPGDQAFGRVPGLPAIFVPSFPWEERLLEQSAEVAAGRLSVAAAARRVEQQRSELWPELVAGAGYGHRGSLDPVVTLRLGLEIPLWAGQNLKPVLRAAEHELLMARAELRESEALIRAQAALLETRWTQAERQVRRHREEVLPRSQAALDGAHVAYATGRGSLAAMITALQMGLEARSSLARREAERFSIWAAVEALMTPAPEQPAGWSAKGEER